MDSAIAGLIGAGVGAIAGMAGTFIAHSLQSKEERKKWLLSKREEAYSNALRYLLKSLTSRSKITADGFTILSQNEMPSWFSNLSEAQSWITSLTIYSSVETKESINSVSKKFNASMSMMMGSSGLIASEQPDTSPIRIDIADNGLSDIAESVAFAYTEILKCAQIDLGKHINQVQHKNAN